MWLDRGPLHRLERRAPKQGVLCGPSTTMNSRARALERGGSPTLWTTFGVHPLLCGVRTAASSTLPTKFGSGPATETSPSRKVYRSSVAASAGGRGGHVG